EIDKRIPVAAGLGGGSADAAAVLRLAKGEVSGLEEIALGLGADVPSQVDPGFGLVSGAGERMERLPAPGSFGVLLLPFALGLSAGEVYAEADRLGLGRSLSELESVAAELREAAGSGGSPLGYSALLRNDLEDAALSVRPEIGDALDLLRDVGAAAAFVSGSGPTAVGIFDDIVRADRAYGDLGPAWADAIVTASA
ncbi:MAG: 4-(cytidine 5'-diphospho)-2-C-methyl-D-erythritol kinase, partial [Actinomycetota bacterium]|nr:4-(cytidine 5'-diphospho)-2-C-methyl-D-erythritol kinase [Actinomycetota bacterium]